MARTAIKVLQPPGQPRQVAMGVIESRQQRQDAAINHLGVNRGQAANVGVAADSYDTVASYRHGFDARTVGLNGQHVGVEQSEGYIRG